MSVARTDFDALVRREMKEIIVKRHAMMKTNAVDKKWNLLGVIDERDGDTRRKTLYLYAGPEWYSFADQALGKLK